MKKLFWKIYYYFKPVKPQIGKSNYVLMLCRVNGWKYKNMIEVKREK